MSQRNPWGAGDAALIGGGTAPARSAVEGGAAGEQGAGVGGAAVVLQRGEPRVDVLRVGRPSEPARVVTAEVVALRADHADEPRYDRPASAWGVLSLPGTPSPSPLHRVPGWLADMTDKKIWLVTGAARGMGVDIATAALTAGHAVVATARNAAAVTAALGDPDDLLAVPLDITDPASVDAAVAATVERFGRIDVLVNNAGNFYAGYFEEISPAQMRAQIETNLFGPMNVTRAVLPVMRRQRSGHVVTISSTAGLIGQEFVVAYAASKFGVEGWMESLRFDVEPFGIHTTIVEPGFFRTELLVEGSVHDLARAVHRRLRRPHAVDDRGVARDERPAGRRPGQARRRARHHHRPRRPPAPLRRRRRRRRRRRTEGARPARPDRRPPRPVHPPRPRRRRGMTLQPAP